MRKFLNSLLSVKVLVWVFCNYLLMKKIITSDNYVVLTLGFLGIRSFDQYQSKLDNKEIDKGGNE